MEGNPEGTLGGISYIFSFVFYGSIEAITEAVHKWFYFSSSASVWLQHLVYECVFTRSVHQPLVYAFGAPTTYL